MNAEIHHTLNIANGLFPLQWGRVRMNAEICWRFALEPPIAELQWGRVRMNAEIMRLASGAVIGILASMGPRSDERGNVRAIIDYYRDQSLQWGRVRMNAEII